MSISSSFSPPTRNQVIAMAGIFQACQLVDTLAQSGNIPSQAFNTCVDSIFEQNPIDTESVYGGLGNLRIGIESMLETLCNQKNGRPPDALRYALGVNHLQRTLVKNRKVLNKVAEGIEKGKLQAGHYGNGHENVVANLANLYQETLSTFRYRIQVNGQANYLQQASIANRIRTLLLAGVRSSVLWSQLGGSRWQLLFYRQRMQTLLTQLHKELL